GLAMLFGFGATCGVRAYGSARWFALLPLVLYLIGMISISHSAIHWWLLRGQPVRAVVLGVETAHQTHPAKTIVLDGVPRAVYDDSIAQGAFYPLGIDGVYLTPGTPAGSGPNIADPEKTVLDPAAMFHAIANDQVVIYSVTGDHLRNITKDYERSAPNRFTDRLPVRLDAGNPLYSWLLGPTWLQPDSGTRWMPGEATVRLKAPEKQGTKLELDGFFPQEELRTGPRRLTVFVDGIQAGITQVYDPESEFHRLFPMPDLSAGKDVAEIRIVVSPVVRRAGQEYGAVFGKIAVRQ
ncbi:MAG: hypothetical protein KGN84_01445, partial [Acidobacteriota bacterium]|nr:hypothetical protein [Acidobacteriota bacterium]